MMTEHIPMNQDAANVAVQAYEHAIRLGHHYLGSEHFLLALAAADQTAGAVLRGRGVTPERVEEEIVRLAGGGLFGDLDPGALATVGIDVSAVRASAEASFGPEALSQAARAAHQQAAAPRWSPRRRMTPAPHGPGVVASLENAQREAQARHAPQVGVEHLALGLLAAGDGMLPPVLAAVGVSAPVLRAAIMDGYRQAS
jgi:ATP-dependent Clp protease ATP-binding subunit ClpA